MMPSSARRRAAVLPACGALGLPIPPAATEVRFGPGVRIGGHDSSNRRSGNVHIGHVKRLRGPAGCKRIPNGL